MEIKTVKELEEAISKYEDMMAELQPLLWQRDELYKAIETAVTQLGETVTTSNFIYECVRPTAVDYEAAAKEANIPQVEIDAATLVAISLPKTAVTDEWLKEMEAAGATVNVKAPALSKLKIPLPLKKKYTIPQPTKLKVSKK